MRNVFLITAIGLMFGANFTYAKQQLKMEDCNQQHSFKRPEERQAFLKTCLKSAPNKNMTTTGPKDKTKQCSIEATNRGLKGSARGDFMSQCLKG
jgi:hypothetical protein